MEKILLHIKAHTKMLNILVDGQDKRDRGHTNKHTKMLKILGDGQDGRDIGQTIFFKHTNAYTK